MELSPNPAAQVWVLFLPFSLQTINDSTSNQSKALECPQRAAQVDAEVERRAPARSRRSGQHGLVSGVATATLLVLIAYCWGELNKHLISLDILSANPFLAVILQPVEGCL